MNRTLDVQVDKSTWAAPAQPPPELLALEARSPIDVNVDDALLTAAFCTRPPIHRGFSLADTWAWFRYLPALDPGPGLKLRQEWETIDPHQKMILSDDFGVGFTMSLLRDTLALTYIADTLFVVNLLAPGLYLLKRRARRGPAKSPDYLVIDRHARFGVIECKGTQSSLQELDAALERGLAQKANVTQGFGPRLHHKLVGGLFVPQAGNGQTATLVIRDPEWQQLGDQLRAASDEQLGLAISRIGTAKECCLAGLTEGARYLALTPVQEFTRTAFIDRLRTDLDHLGQREPSRSPIVLDESAALPIGALPRGDRSARVIRFQARLPSGGLEGFADAVLGGWSDNMLEDRIWQVRALDEGAQLVSPSGFLYSVVYGQQPAIPLT